MIKELVATGDFALMPTYTTRGMRPGESQGNPYCFIDEETFRKKIEEGELYEHENVHGNYYGTSRRLLKEKISLGKVLLKDIDVLGTQSLVAKLDKDIKIVTLFLKVDSKEVLVERLTERKEPEIEKRLMRYDMEMSYMDRYDYVINNVELQTTKNTVLKIVSAERSGEKPINACAEIPSAKEIAKLGDSVKQGKRLPPVRVALLDGKIYLINGINEYLASIKYGVPVTKEIINGVSEIKPAKDFSEIAEEIFG